MPVRIWESFRAVFYTPYYAAFARDAFAREGCEAVLGAVPSGTDVGDALRAGQVDVVWGGPMRVLVDHDRHQDSDLTCFCEVVCRDPFSLVGARPRSDFTLKDLFTLKVATVSEVPTPWMCLQEDLRRADLDPDALARITDGTMEQNRDALERSDVDVVQLFEPFVQQLIERKSGAVWQAAADRGLTSYTTFFALRPFLDANPEQAAALCRAIHRTQTWIRQTDEAEIARVVAPYFPDLGHETLAGSIGRYRRNGVWGDTPVMSQEGFDRQADGLLSGGLIQTRPTFDDCVDMRFAHAAVASSSNEVHVEPRQSPGGTS